MINVIVTPKLAYVMIRALIGVINTNSIPFQYTQLGGFKMEVIAEAYDSLEMVVPCDTYCDPDDPRCPSYILSS